MTPNDLPTQHPGAVMTDCEASHQLADWARDLGDRAICLVLAFGHASLGVAADVVAAVAVFCFARLPSSARADSPSKAIA